MTNQAVDDEPSGARRARGNGRFLSRRGGGKVNLSIFLRNLSISCLNQPFSPMKTVIFIKT